MRMVRTCLAALAAGFVLCAPVGAATYATGLDVSHWNGSIDWIQVAGDGYAFLFAKATEGTTFSDITYPLNRGGTQGLGLRIGAYHFARPGGSGDASITASAIAQADHFVDFAQPAAGDLPPALDLETRGGLSPANLVHWTQAWLDEVAARTGVHALIYASPNFWKTSLSDTAAFAGNGNPLWIAHWTTNAAPLVPASNWGGFGWTFWQWTKCTKAAGFANCSDGDRANGPSPAPFAIKPYPTGAAAPNAPPTIVGTAKAGAQLAGVPGTWSGGKPVAFTYQWQRCDAAGAGCAPIPGATLETYAATAADVGHALALTVAAASPGGTATASSPPTVAVAAAGSSGATQPAVLTPPLLSGTPQVGQTLTANAGTWSGSPSAFAYLWRRCDAAGATCTAVAGATGSSYVLTPGDIGFTLSLVVTATGKGGSRSASAPTTAAVAAAPVPAAVAGSLVAQPGLAGAVVTADGRATVTWQPGAVPVGTTVALVSGDAALTIPGTVVSLTLAPAQQAPLPWPVDLAYAAAPTDQILGVSIDGKVWLPVPTLTSPALPEGVDTGSYAVGTTLHVLTRQAGQLALFRPGRWGDPRRVSPHAPVVRRLAPLTVTRQRDGTVLLVTRLSTSSQSHLYASVQTARPLILKRGSRLAVPLGAGATRTVQALVLNAGGFPVRLHFAGHGLLRGALVRILVTAIDPWGRQGSFTVSFHAP
jgi:GH25 family lysozyme M1 (1,4-beta-N-acetylmuramidase)